MKWFFLTAAIIGELIGTSALKSAEGFTKIGPSFISIIGYAFAFYFLSPTLKEIPVGIAYALWSAIGIVLISVIGYLLYDQRLDLPAIIGLGFIVTGVVITNLFSKWAVH